MIGVSLLGDLSAEARSSVRVVWVAVNINLANEPSAGCAPVWEYVRTCAHIHSVSTAIPHERPLRHVGGSPWESLGIDIV